MIGLYKDVLAADQRYRFAYVRGFFIKEDCHLEQVEQAKVGIIMFHYIYLFIYSFMFWIKFELRFAPFRSKTQFMGYDSLKGFMHKYIKIKCHMFLDGALISVLVVRERNFAQLKTVSMSKSHN